MHLPFPPVLSTLCLLLSLSPSIHAHGSHADSKETRVNPSTCHPHSIETLPPKFFPKHNSQRLKLTYGPYTVPSMHLNNGMISFGGLVAPPCTDCLTTYMSAGLSYANTHPANASTGMWLHHTVWTNLARSSPVIPSCPPPKYPRGDRFFASGNERTPIDLTANGTVKAGYPIYNGDVLAMGGELMNMRGEVQEVFLSVTFEFVPRLKKQRGFRKVRGYWLDVGGCEGSNVPAREDAVWDDVSPAVRVERGGTVVFVASHLHDGGVRAEVRRDGVVVCESLAGYQKVGEGGVEHIDRLSTCGDVGETRKGDEWSVRSYYDTTVHAPMRNMDGSLEPVMGISMVYVAVGKVHGLGRGKVKVFLGVGILVLTLVLGVLWARMNGRDWLGRRKAGVRLEGGEGREDQDRKAGGWVPVEGYTDEE